jgi:CheY-like chemotaxis protein
MSESIAMPPPSTSETKHTPTVYFIDDSATMREVIKIAFRRENINVITCADAASALAQFEQHHPDVVITDVIMPDQDGYSVCSQIKQNPQFGKTPVILMSGVVNKTVADRAVAVQADELVRKPFQPQELIARVRNLLSASIAPEASQPEHQPPANALDGLFAPPPTRAPDVTPISSPPPPPNFPQTTQIMGPNGSAWPRALAEAFSYQGQSQMGPVPTATAPPAPRAATPPAEIHKLRAEIAHLELLVKKLQTELQIERQYNQALELHVRTLTRVE